MLKSILFLVATLLISCSVEEKNKNKVIVENAFATDVKNEDIKGDTSFLKFFTKFMWDAAFQKTRILFPFDQHGKTIKSSKEWIHLPFFSRYEYFPTLTSDTLSTYEKDIKQASTTLYVVDFNNKTASSFAFEKMDNIWILKRNSKIAFSNVPDFEFVNFFLKFTHDSVFQAKNIAFPIRESFSDPENDYETAERKIQKDDWIFWDITSNLNEVMMFSDIQRMNKYRNLFFRGVENGIWVKYTFEKINGNWKLIRIEDYST